MEWIVLHSEDTPSPLFVVVLLLLGSVGWIIQAEHSCLSGLMVYSHDEIKSWILRDCMGYDVDLGTKGWSGGNDRKVVLSCPVKEGTKWSWLGGQGTRPSDGSQLEPCMCADSMPFLHRVWFSLQGDPGRRSKQSCKRLYYAPTSGWCPVLCIGCILSWFSPKRSWDRRDYKGKDHPYCISWDKSQRADTTLLTQLQVVGRNWVDHSSLGWIKIICSMSSADS